MAAKKWEELQDGPASIPARLQRLGFARYADYLASEHWLDVRRRYAASDRPQRCACGKARHALHHLTYVRLGCELLEDLVAVCDPCHRRLHKKDRARQRQAMAEHCAKKRASRSAKKRRQRARRRARERATPPLSAERKAELMVRPSERSEWRFDRDVKGQFAAAPDLPSGPE
jgi:hypothetical protein